MLKKLYKYFYEEDGSCTWGIDGMIPFTINLKYGLFLTLTVLEKVENIISDSLITEKTIRATLLLVESCINSLFKDLEVKKKAKIFYTGELTGSSRKEKDGIIYKYIKFN